MNEQFKINKILVKDTIELMDLPLSKLLLMNDSQYPWFILVPKVANVQEIYHLTPNDQQQLLDESSHLSAILMQVFDGDKMNVAALGNICPQLHVHHIVRYRSDKAWPKPVWGEYPALPYSELALVALKTRLMPPLQSIQCKKI